MRVIFTIVLYRNTINEISRLLDSINNLKEYQNIEIVLSICDNSEISIDINLLRDRIDKNFELFFEKSENIGYGKGHNLAFKNAYKNKKINKNDLLIITNPDIYFQINEFIKILNFLNQKKNEKIVCLAPLIKNEKGEIQYSAKKNPTIMSLLIGRIKILEKFYFFQKYISNNQNRSLILTKILNCNFLSGCFLVVKPKIFKKINGFDKRYFLHFEDADITRTLSKYGECIHYPYATIIHKWNRGSHKSFKQTLMLIKSMIKYFLKWGISLL